MQHDEFMDFFLKGLRMIMNVEDQTNPYANLGFKFASSFMFSFNCENGDTHPILKSTFDYLLDTTSLEVHIRARICQFVGILLDKMNPDEANIDDDFYDKVLSYMTGQLSDENSMVRTQAIYALKRLQNPVDPNDKIIKLYSTHLSKDRATQVRQAVLKSIGLNATTMPIILERLSDVKAGVRRLVYLQIGNYPFENYTSAQLSQVIKHGLKDDDRTVHNSFRHFVLVPWFQSYGEKCIPLFAAFKIENISSEDEFYEFVEMLKPVSFILFE